MAVSFACPFLIVVGFRVNPPSYSVIFAICSLWKPMAELPTRGWHRADTPGVYQDVLLLLFGRPCFEFVAIYIPSSPGIG